MKLFVEAGVTKKELEDPSTAMMLMGIVAEKITNKSKPQQQMQAPQQQQQQPQAPTTNQRPAPPTQTKAPPANVPAPPPPPSISVAPPPAAPALKPPSTPTSAPSSNAGSSKPNDLLAQIRAGTSLKRVEDDPGLGELSTDDKTDLTNVLMRAINDHRKNLREEDHSDNDDDWDD